MSFVVMLFALVLFGLARASTRRPHGGRPLWVVAMIGSELAGWFVVTTAGVLALTLLAGWSDGLVGIAAAVVLGGALVGFVVALGRGYRSGTALTAAVARFTGDATPLRYRHLAAAAWPIARPGKLRIERDLSYGSHPRHILDRITGDGGKGLRPAVVYVHGGGWWRGRHSTQARPALYRLARAGWEVFTPAYRLSPEASFPDHVIDIKRAIAWIRAHADTLGVDRRFIAVVGGSTGGNIAALVALAGTDSDLQPGFESADASVQACIPIYGVHDMLRPSGEPLWPYLATSVMKSTPATDPEAWRRASPARAVTAERPPFFVIHGGSDTLVPPGLSRALVDALGAAGGPPFGYAEVPWANHGFDFFAGPRGRITAAAMGRILDHLYAGGT